MTDQIHPADGRLVIRTRDGRSIERPLPRIIEPRGWALAWLAAGTFGWALAGAVADPVTAVGASLVLVALLHGIAVSALSHGDPRGRLVATAVVAAGSGLSAIALLVAALSWSSLPLDGLGDPVLSRLAVLAAGAVIQSGYAIALSELVGTAARVAAWLDGRTVSGR
jgi:hypothetical protein